MLMVLFLVSQLLYGNSIAQYGRQQLVHTFLRLLWAWLKEELNKGPRECKANVLANELLHTIMWITHVIQQI